MTMPSPHASSKRGRLILLPTILMLLLAAGWSAGWFYAASRADDVVEAWVQREARDGRTYTCGNRTVGGFPFRIEVRCTDVTAELRDRRDASAAPVVLKVRELLAVAQVYRPDLIITEVYGPMRISIPGAGEDYLADWTLLQASVRGRPATLDRVSLVADAPRITRPSTPADAAPVAKATRLQAHARRNPESPADKPVFDLAVSTTGGAITILTALNEKPFDLEATATLTGMHDFSGRPIPQRLRDWQAAEGRLTLASARFVQGDALATATGTLGLNDQGRVNGRFDLKLAGLDSLAQMLLGSDGAAGSRAGLLANLGMRVLPRTDLEGRRAIAVPLEFREGRVFFGPIPVAQIAPLF